MYMIREELMLRLESMGMVDLRYGEDYSPKNDGEIWESAEDLENQIFFDYYSMSSEYDLGIRYDIYKFLEHHGWYAEWNDPGTIFITRI